MILTVCPNPSVDTYVWVESLAPAKVHRAGKEVRYPGGKGVHVALAAAELGEEVTLLGFWGGPTGEWIKNQCEKLGINCIGPEISEWTRSCITFKSEGEYDETELLGCGPTISIKEYNSFIQAFKAQLIKADVVTMSGSWPKGSPEDGYAQMVLETNQMELPVLLDATGKSFEVALSEKPYGIHLNQSETLQLTGEDNFLIALNKIKKKVKLSAITAGKDGLFLGLDEQMMHGQIQLEKIYSAVGSGDCLTAGIAVAIKRKYDIEDMLRLGVSCGAANCLRKDLGMLYKNDVDELFNKVKINSKFKL